MASRIHPLVIHVVAWLLFFALIVSFTLRGTYGAETVNQLLSKNYLILFGIYICLFYLNDRLLIPALYLQKKYFAYFSILAILFVVVLLYQPFDRIMTSPPRVRFEHAMPPPLQAPHRNRILRPDLVSVLLFIITWSVSTAGQIFRQWRTSEARAARAEADHVNAELSFLKAQINPHFLFNTLNNIYSLSVMKSESTPAAIMKLSNIMRYITDEAKQEYVPLENEVRCIQDYIGLQRLRLNEKTQCSFSVTGDITNKKIIPLVLMTFVENIFKYGISHHDPSDIHIQCTAEANSFHFFSRNRIFPQKQSSERTGIGLTNTRQRLEYAYPGKYTLDIKTGDGYYTISLTISM